MRFALWKQLAFDTVFYLYNFTYIGTCVAVGLALHTMKYKYARLAVQLSVGLYMLLYLGVISRENMQIEGFWVLLFHGVFQAAVIHFAVAKIVGPLLFGRAWCGYACWTAMILDLLPFKQPREPRKRLGFIRYILFAVSLLCGILLFRLQVPLFGDVMFYGFVAGNVLYYAAGIALAYAFKDNRAFCKYICPITVFLKPASYFSILRVKYEQDKCISCNRCNRFALWTLI